mmetsp:Transcript_15913/g.40768  ORF Transcript_15913/g.40768 Transcript_15913/m.40768 type:complete len:1367 (-) Transcript_15913:1183-5283(-)
MFITTRATLTVGATKSVRANTLAMATGGEGNSVRAIGTGEWAVRTGVTGEGERALTSTGGAVENGIVGAEGIVEGRARVAVSAFPLVGTLADARAGAVGPQRRAVHTAVGQQRAAVAVAVVAALLLLRLVEAGTDTLAVVAERTAAVGQSAVSVAEDTLVAEQAAERIETLTATVLLHKATRFARGRMRGVEGTHRAAVAAPQVLTGALAVVLLGGVLAECAVFAKVLGARAARAVVAREVLFAALADAGAVHDHAVALAEGVVARTVTAQIALPLAHLTGAATLGLAVRAAVEARRRIAVHTLVALRAGPRVVAGAVAVLRVKVAVVVAVVGALLAHTVELTEERAVAGALAVLRVVGAVHVAQILVHGALLAELAVPVEHIAALALARTRVQRTVVQANLREQHTDGARAVAVQIEELLAGARAVASLGGVVPVQNTVSAKVCVARAVVALHAGDQIVLALTRARALHEDAGRTGAVRIRLRVLALADAGRFDLLPESVVRAGTLAGPAVEDATVGDVAQFVAERAHSALAVDVLFPEIVAVAAASGAHLSRTVHAKGELVDALVTGVFHGDVVSQAGARARVGVQRAVRAALQATGAVVSVRGVVPRVQIAVARARPGHTTAHGVAGTDQIAGVTTGARPRLDAGAGAIVFVVRASVTGAQTGLAFVTLRASEGRIATALAHGVAGQGSVATAIVGVQHRCTALITLITAVGGIANACAGVAIEIAMRAAVPNDVDKRALGTGEAARRDRPRSSAIATAGRISLAISVHAVQLTFAGESTGARDERVHTGTLAGGRVERTAVAVRLRVQTLAAQSALLRLLSVAVAHAGVRVPSVATALVRVQRAFATDLVGAQLARRRASTGAIGQVRHTARGGTHVVAHQRARAAGVGADVRRRASNALAVGEGSRRAVLIRKRAGGAVLVAVDRRAVAAAHTRARIRGEAVADLGGERAHAGLAVAAGHEQAVAGARAMCRVLLTADAWKRAAAAVVAVVRQNGRRGANTLALVGVGHAAEAAVVVAEEAELAVVAVVIGVALAHALCVGREAVAVLDAEITLACVGIHLKVWVTLAVAVISRVHKAGGAARSAAPVHTVDRAHSTVVTLVDQIGAVTVAGLFQEGGAVLAEGRVVGTLGAQLAGEQSRALAKAVVQVENGGATARAVGQRVGAAAVDPLLLAAARGEVALRRVAGVHVELGTHPVGARVVNAGARVVQTEALRAGAEAARLALGRGAATAALEAAVAHAHDQLAQRLGAAQLEEVGRRREVVRLAGDQHAHLVETVGGVEAHTDAVGGDASGVHHVRGGDQVGETLLRAGVVGLAIGHHDHGLGRVQPRAVQEVVSGEHAGGDVGIAGRVLHAGDGRRD